MIAAARPAFMPGFGIKELWVIDAVRLDTRIHREPTSSGYQIITKSYFPSQRLVPALAPALAVTLSRTGPSIEGRADRPSPLSPADEARDHRRRRSDGLGDRPRPPVGPQHRRYRTCGSSTSPAAHRALAGTWPTRASRSTPSTSPTDRRCGGPRGRRHLHQRRADHAGLQMEIFEAASRPRGLSRSRGAWHLHRTPEGADARFRDAGVCAVIGAGADPGMSNVLCRRVADEFDTIERLNSTGRPSSSGPRIRSWCRPMRLDGARRVCAAEHPVPRGTAPGSRR